MSQYRLKIGARTLKLPEGSVDVGRSPDCWLTLDDDLVSRYHARFHISADVVLEDLSSRNGTYVNGEQLHGKITLQHADKVRIGREVITVVSAAAELDDDDDGDALRRTIGPGEDSKFPSLIGALVEKSLSMGKIKEAERYALALTNQLSAAKVPVDHPTAESAVSCLVALAEKSAAGVWLDRVFKLHASKGWIMRPVVVERIRSALDRIPRVPGTGLQDYETALRTMSREGQDVPAKLLAEIGEILDTYAS